jgi:colanic acid biosynthesis protein WcaH
LERVVREELGISGISSAASFVGVFEHMYEDNVFHDPEFGTHYVVLAYKLKNDLSLDTIPGDEHMEFQWWTIKQLKSSPDVHPFTKAYFE